MVSYFQKPNPSEPDHFLPREIIQIDSFLNLCSEFMVNRKHLQFYSFSYRHIISLWACSPLQLMEADKGLDKGGITMESPTWQREGLTARIPSRPPCLCFSKMHIVISHKIYMMTVKIQIQRKLKWPLSPPSHEYL